MDEGNAVGECGVVDEDGVVDTEVVIREVLTNQTKRRKTTYII